MRFGFISCLAAAVALSLVSAAPSFASEAVTTCSGGTSETNTIGLPATSPGFGTTECTIGTVDGSTIYSPIGVDESTFETFLGVASGTYSNLQFHETSAISFPDFSSGSTGGVVTFTYSTDAVYTNTYFYTLNTDTTNPTCAADTTCFLTGSPTGSTVTFDVPANYSGFLAFGVDFPYPPDPNMTIGTLAYTPNTPGSAPEPVLWPVLALGLCGLFAARKLFARA